MRTYSFVQGNKGRAGGSAALEFPRLALEKKGETARIALFSVGEKDGKPTVVEPQPEGGYFFDLFNPLNEGNPYAGSFECLASEEAKEQNLFPADECPHCEFVSKGIGGGSDPVIGRRRRKFVLPVLVYRTNFSGALLDPFNVEVKAWKFTDRYFNIITDEHEKWNILKHDLTLTCQVPQFHTYAISVEPGSAWQADSERTAQTLRTYVAAMEQVPGGFIRLQGLHLEADQLRSRIERVLDEAEGGVNGGSVSSKSMEAESLDEVLGSTQGLPAPFESGGGSSDDPLDFDSFFGRGS